MTLLYIIRPVRRWRRKGRNSADMSAAVSIESNTNANSMNFTHDHRGRRLSPALSELLSTTVIPPRPKGARKRQKSPSPSAIMDTDDSENDEAESIEERRCQRIQQRRIDIPDMEDVSGSDHPLSDYMNDEEEDAEDDESETESSFSDFDTPADSISKPLNSLVSNLTASLRAVAQTFASNNDSSLHSFNFSPRITDEPIPSRFMHDSYNKFKTTTTVTNNEQQQEQPKEEQTLKPKKPLAMKTYAIQSTLIPHLRPREVRMNPEFYRIFAVENRMKRNGKLNADFVGKAQMFLEPRSDYNQSYLLSEEEGEVFGIRKRFVSSYDNGKTNSATNSSHRWVCINASDNNDENDI